MSTRENTSEREIALADWDNGSALGDALRERFDELEAQGGNQEELDRLAEAIRKYRV